MVSILLAIVPDYGNEHTTKENKNWTSFKHFAPNLNLNQTHTLITFAVLIKLIKLPCKEIKKHEKCDSSTTQYKALRIFIALTP